MAQELETKTKIAIVGTGFGARVQIPGFLKIAGVEICGVMSSGRYERAEEVAQEFGIANVCHSYEELLALPGLDAVSIVTPPYQHHSQTLAALEAGKHVLCEKPMAMNLQEAREMVKAVQRTGLIGMIDHEFRYIPARAYAQELIRDGWLGELYWANISTLTGTAADPHTRPYGWLFQKSAGGGVRFALSGCFALLVWRNFGGAGPTLHLHQTATLTRLKRTARCGCGRLFYPAIENGKWGPGYHQSLGGHALWGRGAH